MYMYNNYYTSGGVLNLYVYNRHYNVCNSLVIHVCRCQQLHIYTILIKLFVYSGKSFNLHQYSSHDVTNRTYSYVADL